MSAQRAPEPGEAPAVSTTLSFPYRGIRALRIVGHAVSVGEGVHGSAACVARARANISELKV